MKWYIYLYLFLPIVYRGFLPLLFCFLTHFQILDSKMGLIPISTLVYILLLLSLLVNAQTFKLQHDASICCILSYFVLFRYALSLPILSYNDCNDFLHFANSYFI
jgi:hypothetical protein